MPAPPRSRHCTMLAGQKTISSPCHNSWRSLPSRSAQLPACERWPSPKRREPTLTDNVITHPENHEPTEFTLAMLDWLPWLEPPTEDALTERQRASLVDP